jgi:hypothetical protein
MLAGKLMEDTIRSPGGAVVCPFKMAMIKFSFSDTNPAAPHPGSENGTGLWPAQVRKPKRNMIWEDDKDRMGSGWVVGETRCGAYLEGGTPM